MRILSAAAMAAVFTLPALSAQADETSGQVLAYDRKAGILVLTDKTVWELAPDLLVPADLGHGDMVRLEYSSAGEDGLETIDALTRSERAQPEAEDGGN